MGYHFDGDLYFCEKNWNFTLSPDLYYLKSMSTRTHSNNMSLHYANVFFNNTFFLVLITMAVFCT